MFEDPKNSSKSSIRTLNCKGRLLVLDQPKIMGILNVTPDSFYDGQSDFSTADFITKGLKLIEEGADIVDIGGQSTRPGSERVSPELELKRILPVIDGLISERPDAIISVDTYHSSVAIQAITRGASMVNDVSAGNIDPLMIETIGTLRVPYVIMHMKGTPETMQQEPTYEDLIKEIFDYFIMKIAACRKAGIKDLIIDPGFGFGKNLMHNFQLLQQINIFKNLDVPVLAGLSRKSMIYKLLSISPDKALNGTSILNTLALINGVDILRVHDVKESKECIKLTEQYKKGSTYSK